MPTGKTNALLIRPSGQTQGCVPSLALQRVLAEAFVLSSYVHILRNQTLGKSFKCLQLIFMSPSYCLLTSCALHDVARVTCSGKGRVVLRHPAPAAHRVPTAEAVACHGKGQREPLQPSLGTFPFSRCLLQPSAYSASQIKQLFHGKMLSFLSFMDCFSSQINSPCCTRAAKDLLKRCDWQRGTDTARPLLVVSGELENCMFWFLIKIRNCDFMPESIEKKCGVSGPGEWQWVMRCDRIKPQLKFMFVFTWPMRHQHESIIL